MPLPRPASVSTVTTEGSTCRTSAGMSPVGGAACVVAVLPVLAVVVEVVRAEELHPASTTTAITTTIRVQIPRCAVDRRCITRHLCAGTRAGAVMRSQKSTGVAAHMVISAPDRIQLLPLCITPIHPGMEGVLPVSLRRRRGQLRPCRFTLDTRCRPR